MSCSVEREVNRATSISEVHLIGLNFSRAEGLAELAILFGQAAAAVGSGEEEAPGEEQEYERLAKAFADNARKHFRAGEPWIGCGDWMADHWVSTFALLAWEALQRISSREEGSSVG